MWDREKVENAKDGWTRDAPGRDERPTTHWPSDQQQKQHYIKPVIFVQGNETQLPEANLVDSANPTTVYPNVEVPSIYADGTRSVELFLHLTRTIGAVYDPFLIYFSNSLLSAAYSQDAVGFRSPGFGGLAVIYKVLPDWDPTTLTWNTKPASSIVNIVDYGVGVSGSFFKAPFGVLITGSINGTQSVASSEQCYVGLSLADAGGVWNGSYHGYRIFIDWATTDPTGSITGTLETMVAIG